MAESLILIRTCFSRAQEWEGLLRSARNPPEPFIAWFGIVDDASYSGMQIEDLFAKLPSGYEQPVFFVADERSMSQPEFPCLVVATDLEKPRSFRAVASTLASIDSNLSIANMDFEEFADSVGQDGVFRGFE